MAKLSPEQRGYGQAQSPHRRGHGRVVWRRPNRLNYDFELPAWNEGPYRQDVPK
jgi:hypothetical protein